eukprot:NODE_8732_length_1473_cov_11.338039.p1 GENE.NODE_8732_length_1473_cov_11.338039~~NODE_8732_length_1473_cov_11.338039.p1  ORF type:complete len:417 (+),score=49.68 NODE_8732_length_1473_cov_11.338039:133-1251(+)
MSATWPDATYSQVVTTAEFAKSNFRRMYPAPGIHEHIPKGLGMQALYEFLAELKLDVNATMAILNAMFSHNSLHLYTTDIKCGDIAKYYIQVNMLLNRDDGRWLKLLMPLLKRMIYLINVGADGRPLRHKGGVLYKGSKEKPSERSMRLLVEAQATGSVVRFPQFQSTSSNPAVADDFSAHGGFLWVIHVESGFWGARDVADLSAYAHEAETLFPPYSAFRVTRVDGNGAELIAVDKYIDIGNDTKVPSLLASVSPLDGTFQTRGVARVRNGGWGFSDLYFIRLQGTTIIGSFFVCTFEGGITGAAAFTIVRFGGTISGTVDGDSLRFVITPPNHQYICTATSEGQWSGTLTSLSPKEKDLSGDFTLTRLTI